MKRGLPRWAVFVISLLYLFGLLGLAMGYFSGSALPLMPSAGSFGPVPVGVPWFGALGAVLISLTGVFEHEHDWDNSYWPWHLARPFIGASLGVVSVLIFQAGILAVGSAPVPPAPALPTAVVVTPAPGTPTPAALVPSTETPVTPVAPAQAPTPYLYFLIAFLVGYREETFRDLIKRLADVILTPGGSTTSVPKIESVDPPNAPHDAATPVTITGSGLTTTQSVRFGSEIAKFSVTGDGLLTATSPIVAAPGNAALTVTTKGGSATHPFQLT